MAQDGAASPSPHLNCDKILKYSEECDGDVFTFCSKHSKTPTALLNFRVSAVGQQTTARWRKVGSARWNTEIANKSHPCSLSLSSSLALSPVGFPRVTICRYRSSFASLGNVPFYLPLWNSDLSLSTTLLHTPHLAVYFLPNSSPGNFPRGASSGALWHSFCLTHQNHSARLNIQSQPGQYKGTLLSLLHSRPFIRKARKMQWWVVKNTHTHKASPPSDLGKWCWAWVVHPTEAFSSGVYIDTKKSPCSREQMELFISLVPDTRATLHVHDFSYYRRDRFHKIKLNFTFGARCCCLYGTNVEWYPSNASDCCGNTRQKSGEVLGYKKHRAEMVPDTGTSL